MIATYKKPHILAAIVLTLCTALSFGSDLRGLAEAKDEKPVNQNPLKGTAQLEKTKVIPGENNKLLIDIQVDKGHHAYKDMFKVKWIGEPGVTVGSIDVSPVKKFMDKFSKKVREGVEGLATVSAPIVFPENSPLGNKSGTIALTYQACSERYCLFPKTVNFDINYSVVERPSPSLFSKNVRFEDVIGQGTFLAFLFVFIAGFLTSLTPCVFPMIPITISIIGAQSANQSKSRSFALSLAYVFGIATTYSTLGVVAASTGALFGAFLGNIWVVSAIAFIFFLMALSMFGLFEIQVPAFLRNKFGNSQTGTGIPGAFVAGLFAGIVASPCIGPVLVGILTYVAQTAQLFLGFTLLFTFAMGLGVLFLALGTSTSLLNKIPKSGPWMDGIKNIFGVTFIAVGLYYLQPVLSENIFWTLSGVTLIGLTSYLGAFAPSTNSKVQQLLKGILIALFFTGLWLALHTLFPQTSTDGSTIKNQSKTGLSWETYSDEKVIQAKKDGKPVIIDFWAEWCKACHELEEKTFTDSSVMEKGKEFVLLKMDMTTTDNKVTQLKKQYQILGLPTVLFIDKKGSTLDALTVTGFVTGSEFLGLMNQAHKL